MELKVRIKNSFKDKYTGQIYKEGQEAVLPLDRVNEIILVGGLIQITGVEEPAQAEEEPAQAEEKAPAKKGGKK